MNKYKIRGIIDLEYILFIITVTLCFALNDHLYQVNAEKTYRVLCGDGICSSPQENVKTCSIDCSSTCGDGICTIKLESHETCPRDYHMCRWVHGEAKTKLYISPRIF